MRYLLHTKEKIQRSMRYQKEDNVAKQPSARTKEQSKEDITTFEFMPILFISIDHKITDTFTFILGNPLGEENLAKTSLS
jgi:hypothetical protein